MEKLFSLVANFKVYIVVATIAFATGASSVGFVVYKYVTTTKNNEILTIKTTLATQQYEYANALVEKERQNASTTTTLNARIEQLNSEKSKILASISSNESIRNGMLNAKCGSGKQENTTSSGSANASETATSYCKLNKDAESALFGYIKQVEELNVYSQAAYEYVKAVEEQRQRMIKEQQ